MNSIVSNIQPLAGGGVGNQLATLLTPRTGLWREEAMMRDARPKSEAFAPVLSLVRDVIDALESSRSYDIAPFDEVNAANSNDRVLCCCEDSAKLESALRANMREKSATETPAVSNSPSFPVTVPAKTLCFALNGQKAVCWIASANLNRSMTERSDDSVLLGDEQAPLLLNMLLEEMLADKTGRRSISHYLLHALLLTVEREVSRGRAVQSWSEGETAGQRENDDDPIDHARLYIESHLNQPLTIESVARQVYMSRAQFAKRFREQTGRTFIDYVNDYRLRQAEKFLRETTWPIAHITEMVGFKSDSYFHRLFRREVGVSPMEYRRQHQPGQHQPGGGDAQ